MKTLVVAIGFVIALTGSTAGVATAGEVLASKRASPL